MGTTINMPRKNREGEWFVTVTIDGKNFPSRTYFAADREDAIQTRQAMIQEAARIERADGCQCGEAYGTRVNGVPKCSYCLQGVEADPFADDRCGDCGREVDAGNHGECSGNASADADDLRKVKTFLADEMRTAANLRDRLQDAEARIEALLQDRDTALNAIQRLEAVNSRQRTEAYTEARLAKQRLQALVNGSKDIARTVALLQAKIQGEA